LGIVSSRWVSHRFVTLALVATVIALVIGGLAAAALTRGAGRLVRSFDGGAGLRVLRALRNRPVTPAVIDDWSEDPGFRRVMAQAMQESGLNYGWQVRDANENDPDVSSELFAPLDSNSHVPSGVLLVPQSMIVCGASSGMGLAIYNRTGALVFRQMYGDFNADRRLAIASASKMVAGTVMFRLVDAGYLSVDSTTAEVLGWSGD
jgi:CubicO group peptidase (beta-lactamase class C family)